MAETWRDMPFAPAPGTEVCAGFDGPVASFDLDGFPLVVVRSADGIRAYVNACPHQFLPLDWRSGNVLSGDGRVLRCSNHAAGFDAVTGQGIDGLGTGCALHPVPVEERAGCIVIGGSV